MSYLVLARKWRPQKFSDVVGQEHVTRTLANSIAAGRVAHSFIFSGPRGIGKTTTARILSKALNCEKGPAVEPCNECASCMEITSGSSVDVQEIDGASNTGVDDVRELRDSAGYMPGRSRFKIYIIDEVHMLSKNAFNALLKTLEEPPPHVKFIFATTEPHKIPLTIHSRCQRYDFKRVPRKELVEHLERILGREGIKHTQDALTIIAGQAAGSVRDSLSMLEQVIAYSGSGIDESKVVGALGLVDRRMITGLLKAVASRDREACLALMAEAHTYGYDMKVLAEELLGGMRNLLVLKTGGESCLAEQVTSDELFEMKPLTSLMSAPAMHRAFDVLAHTVDQVARSQHPKIVLEMALMKLMVLEPLRPVEEIIARIAEIESRLSSAPIQTGRPPASIPARASGPQQPEQAAGHQAQLQPPPPALNQPGEWLDILAALKNEFPPMAARAENARFISLEDDRLEIAFDQGSSHARYFREDGNRKIFEKALNSHLGRAVALVIREGQGEARQTRSVAEEKARSEREKAQKARDEASAHPLIQEAVKAFGGKLAGR